MSDREWHEAHARLIAHCASEHGATDADHLGDPWGWHEVVHPECGFERNPSRAVTTKLVEADFDITRTESVDPLDYVLLREE